MNAELETLADNVLSVTDEMPLDDVLQVMNDVDFMLDHLKQLKKSLGESMLSWVQANGSFEFAGKRYIAGKKKKIKCRNVGRCIQAILENCDGDFDEVVKHFASQPIKHGYCRETLGEGWENHFETIEEDTLELKAVPKHLLK